LSASRLEESIEEIAQGLEVLEVDNFRGRVEELDRQRDRQGF
jgi:hypothetical protein